MTDFRTTTQVQADFRRIDPPFAQVRNMAHLQSLLVDKDLDEAALYASGSGPVMYDLGVLSGSEWEGVRQFLGSRLVSGQARSELQRLESDLQAADENGDHVLNNQEIVRFAQTHTDRWANVAQFRSAADVFLNRLPGYISQPNLDPNLDGDQIARLWGVLNHMAGELDRVGAAQANRGTVYGLSLQGFPTKDQNDPPALIRRAMNGTLTPQELAAVHHVLETRMVDGKYEFKNGAPLSPVEIGILGQILERAAAEGHALYGMTIVAGEAETELFAEKNQAARRCLDGTAAALKSPGPAGLQRAFTDCATDMARLEAQNPDRIGARALLMRAYTGDLSPAETALLRRWMQPEAADLGLTCDGTLDCMAQGALQLFQTIARDPWHFIARNGAFFGGTMLYRRLVMRNAFENRLSQACGGQVIDPADAYKRYQQHMEQQMRQSPALRRFFNYWARGSFGSDKFFMFKNFPATFLHIALFNAVAARKDTGNLAVDILTDMPLIALFEGLATYDALNRASISNFAKANPGLCRPQRAADPVPATAPAPEQETNPSQFGVLSPEQIRAMGQADFEAILNGGAPALAPEAVGHLPQELQTLFATDVYQMGVEGGPEIEAGLLALVPTKGDALPIGDILANRYAADNPDFAAVLRGDMRRVAAAFRAHGSISVGSVHATRWALRQYIQNLESGGFLHADAYLPLMGPGGAVATYYGIRESQAVARYNNPSAGFAAGATSYWELQDRCAYNQAHPDEVARQAARNSSYMDEDPNDPMRKYFRPWGPMVAPVTPFGGVPSLSLSPSPGGTPFVFRAPAFALP